QEECLDLVEPDAQREEHRVANDETAHGVHRKILLEQIEHRERKKQRQEVAAISLGVDERAYHEHQKQRIKEPELRAWRPQQRKHFGNRHVAIGVVRQDYLEEPQQQRPENRGINDGVHFIDDQSARAALDQRVIEEQTRQKEEQRHMEAIDDAVHQNVKLFVHWQARIEHPARHMSVDDEDDSDGFGVIDPGVSLLHHSSPCLD